MRRAFRGVHRYVVLAHEEFTRKHDVAVPAEATMSSDSALMEWCRIIRAYRYAYEAGHFTDLVEDHETTL